MFLSGRYTHARMRFFAFSIFLVAVLAGTTCASALEESDTSLVGPCATDNYRDAALVVCRYTPQKDDICFFLRDEKGDIFGHFSQLQAALTEVDKSLAFAMNAGMYHQTRMPVGLYVQDGEEVTSLNINDGPGNFHMKPNGVFWLSAENSRRGAHVATAEAYLKAVHDSVIYATQSGPMLVIDDEIHKRFIPNSDSRKRRNGVGETLEGDVLFVLADSPINFYDFASYFRDVLKTPNALYLDGTISRLYAPELERNDPGAAMGPIIGVVVNNDDNNDQ